MLKHFILSFMTLWPESKVPLRVMYCTLTLYEQLKENQEISLRQKEEKLAAEIKDHEQRLKASLGQSKTELKTALSQRRGELEKGLGETQARLRARLQEREKAVAVAGAALQDAMRKITKGLGFNILILPRGQDINQFHLQGVADAVMPETFVTKLANSKSCFYLKIRIFLLKLLF